jgi:pimeloyl-ACP methyl ester carboxylesterase
VRTLLTTARRRLLARVLLYGAAILVGLPLATSQMLVGTLRSDTFEPWPPWERVTVRAGELDLRAWLAPGDGERAAAVVTHGLGDSLDSYVDVGGVLHQRGHAVLLLDLRAHGGSDGRLTSLGGLEREDVRAGMAFLRGRGEGARGFVLVGTSMGAVTVIRAAAEEPDVRAVVAEAPFDTYRDTVRHHAQLYYGLPAWFPLMPAAIRVAEWRAGFDADEVDTVAAAARVRAPLLLIRDGRDERMPEEVVRRVYDAHPGPKSFWVAPEAGHSGASRARGYWETVLPFLEEHGL